MVPSEPDEMQAKRIWAVDAAIRGGAVDIAATARAIYDFVCGEQAAAVVAEGAKKRHQKHSPAMRLRLAEALNAGAMQSELARIALDEFGVVLMPNHAKLVAYRAGGRLPSSAGRPASENMARARAVRLARLGVSRAGAAE